MGGLVLNPTYLFVAVVVLVTIILTAAVYFRNPRSSTNIIFTALGILVAIWIVVMQLSLESFSPLTILMLIRLTIFVASPINLLFFLLAHTLPSDEVRLGNKIFTILIILTFIVMAICISPYAFVSVDISRNIPNPTPGPGLAIFAAFVLAMDLGAAYVLFNKYRKSVGVAKEQFRYVMLGILFMHALIFFTILVPVGLFHVSNFTAYFPYYTFIFLLFTSYAIIKHRFLDIRLVVARSISFALLVLFLSVVSSAVFWIAAAVILKQQLKINDILTSVIITIVLVLSFNSIKRWFERVTDRVFYKDRYNSQKLLLTISQILSSTLSLQELVTHALNQIMDQIKISQSYVFLVRSGKIVWTAGVGLKRDSQLGDYELSSLITHSLIANRGEHILVFDEIPESTEKQIMRDKNISVVLPLIVKDEVIGAILLGEKSSGDIYSIEDIGVLKILAPEIALAVKNAESYEEIKAFNETLEKRVEQATEEYKAVNEDVYKKNIDLAERNKTLSLLRQIDVVVLSTVTDTALIAQQVANLIVRELHFKMMSLFLVDRKDNTLVELGTAPIEITKQMETQFGAVFKGTRISLQDPNSIIANAVKDRTSYITTRLADIMSPMLTEQAAGELQKSTGIATSLVYPLIVRDEVIGSMVIGIQGVPTSLTAFQRDLIDRLSGVIGIAIDNALLYQKIQEANERLKQIDYMKDEFVSVASHELRTPMTSIRSYLWLALAGKGGELTEKQRFYLERSYNSTTRLIKLVNDMLNVSRIESGRMSFEIEKVDMNTLIDEVIGEVEPRANELGVEIRFSKDMTVPATLADSDKIKEVVINLIGNSLKFTPKGGSITITMEHKDNEVVTHVKDTGEGISADDLPKLFQKFSLIKGSYQTNQRASQGTGLGLYISKSIMKQHQCDIWAESEGRGKGATFSFSLKEYNDRDFEWFKRNLKGVEGLGIIHTEI